MKKIVCVLLSSILFFSLCSCATKQSTRPGDGINYNESEQAEYRRLIDEMPEFVGLKEPLKEYWVHINPDNMSFRHSILETKIFLREVREKIDQSARMSISILKEAAVVCGPITSKLETLRLGKKVRDAGYSFVIRLYPDP